MSNALILLDLLGILGVFSTSGFFIKNHTSHYDKSRSIENLIGVRTTSEKIEFGEPDFMV